MWQSYHVPASKECYYIVLIHFRSSVRSISSRIPCSPQHTMLHFWFSVVLGGQTRVGDQNSSFWHNQKILTLSLVNVKFGWMKDMKTLVYYICQQRMILFLTQGYHEILYMYMLFKSNTFSSFQFKCDEGECLKPKVDWAKNGIQGTVW